jgi:hypothetical protein
LEGSAALGASREGFSQLSIHRKTGRRAINNEREKEDTGNKGWADMRGGLRSLALWNARDFVIETLFYAALVVCPETGRRNIEGRKKSCSL